MIIANKKESNPPPPKYEMMPAAPPKPPRPPEAPRPNTSDERFYNLLKKVKGQRLYPHL